ncbi:MAG: hypothetical protein HZA50_07510 [Planctomycetes bacterium]|nr:hypothetical protein [Planctomycetota bacterium]
MIGLPAQSELAGQTRPPRAWPVAVIAGVAVAAFLVGRLAWHGWDPSAFICAGDVWCDPLATPPGLTVKRAASGYDGQFYYRIALAPSQTGETYCGIRLDNPRYRFQRIGYPAVCHVLSFGRPQLVPWAMIAANWAWIVLIAWVAAKMAIRLGARPIFGLLLAAWPGLLFSLSRCMTETQAIALGMAGLLFFLSNRKLAAALVLSAAALTRETALVIVAGIAIVEFCRAVRQKQLAPFARLTFWAIPFAAWAVWQLAVWRIFGGLPHGGGSNVISPVPFAGLSAVFTEGFQIALTPQGMHGLSGSTAHALMAIYWSAHLCLLIGLLILAVAAVRRSRTDWSIKLACLALICVGCFLRKTTFIEGPESFERQFIEMAVLGSLVIIGAPGRARKIALAAVIAAWFVTAPYAVLLP